MSVTAIEASIRQAVAREADRIKEEVVADAVKRFEAALRRAIGNVAIDLSQFFSVQQMRDELLIHVRMDTKHD